MTTEVLHINKNLVIAVVMTAITSVLASFLMMTTAQPNPANSTPVTIPSADRAFMLT